MRRVLVCKDVNYAASKTSATANTALNPVDLAEGAVGIYGVPRTSVNNKDKLALIIDGGADAAGKVPDGDYDGDHVLIAVGTATGYRQGAPMKLISEGGQVTWEETDYAAAVAQVFHVGYDGTSVAKNLNVPTAIDEYDAIEVKVIDTENEDEGGAIYTDKDNFNAVASDSEEQLSMLAKIQALVNASPEGWVKMEIISNASGSAFATSATVTAVNGAVSLTTSAAHGVDVGDYVVISGETYQAQTGTTGTTLVLDRPYNGVSETVANVNTADAGATEPTNWGMEFTSQVRGKNFGVSVAGVLEDADITYTTAGTQGQGYGADIIEAEKFAAGYLGSTQSYDATMPYPDTLAVSGSAYNVFDFNYKNVMQQATGGTAQKAHNLYNDLKVAFIDSESNGSQAEFEDIMGILLTGTDEL